MLENAQPVTMTRKMMKNPVKSVKQPDITTSIFNNFHGPFYGTGRLLLNDGNSLYFVKLCFIDWRFDSMYNDPERRVQMLDLNRTARRLHSIILVKKQIET